MTKRDLEIFVTVADCGKMSEAARRLYITQSSVSQAVSEMEREYGVLLFERLSRGLHLTDVGRECLAYARRVLALQKELDAFLRFSSQSSHIHVGATVTVGTCVISAILLELGRALPEVRADVLVANTHILEEKLLHSQLDIALVEGVIKHPDLVVERVIEDRLVLICAPDHPFAGRRQVPIEALADQPLILREQGSGTRAQIEEQLLRRRIPMNVVWDCCNSEAIKHAVADGHGISVISQRLVAAECESGRLWSADILEAELLRSFDLVYHKDKILGGALRAFIARCRRFGEEEVSNDQ